MGESDSQQPPLSGALTELPDAEISEILGLVEFIRSKGGRADIYKLASELSMEFGELLAVVQGAELLELVHTPGGDVFLEPLGEEITKVKINQKKELIRKQLSKISIFKTISELLKNHSHQETSKEAILVPLAKAFPNEKVENSFSILIKWGRYAELYGYNDDTQTVYLTGD